MLQKVLNMEAVLWRKNDWKRSIMTLFNEDFTTKTNLSGGIQGGISNGMDIYFRVAFKPIATLLKTLKKVLIKMEILVIVEGKGRH